MKKTISLAIPFGFLAIISIIMILIPRASMASSGTSIIVGDNNKPDQDGPPWYNEEWNYRRPVIISNNGTLLSYYQVRIKLDSTNFDFLQVKADGSDVRFTHSDGTTELYYWIESWNRTNQLAYLWVRVPALTNGDTTIYLYYNNPDVISSLSNGIATFDFFDDNWCQFPGAGCTLNQGKQYLQSLNYRMNLYDRAALINPGLSLNDPWTILTITPTVESGILTLSDGSAIKTVPSFRYNVVGFRANYGLGTGKEWAGFINGTGAQRVTIGEWPPQAVDDLYLFDHVFEDEHILLERVNLLNWHGAYHVYEIRWKSGQSVGDIDHGASTAMSTQSAHVPSIYLPVTLYNDTGSHANFLVDWIYVRQYRDPEPSVMLGDEQGLVDLAITKTDFPDPLYAGEALTYQLTISNAVNINASGVVVTDNLPSGVLLAKASPSQGNCSDAGGVVLCDLDTISALSTASITIVVTTTIEGDIINLASVGSPGYDLFMGNNDSETSTTILPSADLAVAIQGNPEVLLPGDQLTYVITVTNIGPSDAIGVNIVDSLPNEVGSITFSPASCDLINHKVTCPVDNLTQAGAAQIVISATVETAQTMNLINNVTASSASTHDPYLSNNTAETNNLVDVTLPVVNWERPVHNGGTYFTFGGMVMLEASASDNDQVDYVKFLLFDHLHNLWITIGTIYTAPYQVEFNSNILVLKESYQVFAQGFDRVGNNIWQRIFIERLFPHPTYMPFIHKN